MNVRVFNVYIIIKIVLSEHIVMLNLYVFTRAP
jgi:hypothetical protein